MKGEECYFVLDIFDGYVSFARDNYPMGLNGDMFNTIVFWFFKFVTTCGGLT